MTVRCRLIEGAPAWREQIYRHRDRLEATAETDPMALLREFTDASILCLERLKETVDPEALGEAIGMIAGAEHVYVIGQRRAFPIAAYVAYGLTRLEHRTQLLDFVGGMVPQQAATMRATDLLIAIAFAEYTPAVVQAIGRAHV